MSITDELREYVNQTPVPKSRVLMEARERFNAIADRIDAEHEKAMSRAGQLLADAEKDRDYNYANWQDCKQKVLQHNITMDELNAKIEYLMDELSHCIELPKDADGVPWHVGERDEDGNEVIALKLAPDGWYVIAVGEWPYRPESKRHYHAPNVEDVLRQFTDAILEWSGKSGTVAEVGTWSDVAAEYVAKLRLAEGED